MKQKELLAKLYETFLPEGYVGVEIGVDKADTTLCLLKNCTKMKHLYAVDPYFKRDGRCQIVEKKLGSYSNCTFLRLTSDDAVTQVPDKIDFVFVDGDHSFLAVLSDLTNYVPKLKSGGLLTGHDWTAVRSEFGVVQACGEYLLANEHLFQPLFNNEELRKMELGDFKRGGWSEEGQRHLIHKKRPSAFPLWWLVKR